MSELYLYTPFRNNGTMASWRGRARFTAQRSSASDSNIYCSMECWDERSGGDGSSWEGEWSIRYRVYMRFDGPGGAYGDRDAWSGSFTSDGTALRGVISWSQNVPIGAQINGIWCYVYCEVNGGGYNDAGGWMPMDGFIQYNPSPLVEFNPPMITAYPSTIKSASPTIKIEWNAPGSNTKVGYYEIAIGTSTKNFFTYTVPASSRSINVTMNKWEVRRMIEMANGAAQYSATLNVKALTMNTDNGRENGNVTTDHSLATASKSVTVIIDSTKYTEEHLVPCPMYGGTVYEAYCGMPLESLFYPRGMMRCLSADMYFRGGNRTIRYDAVFSNMPRATEYAAVDGPGFRIYKSGVYLVQSALYSNNKGNTNRLCLSVRSTKRERYITEVDVRPTNNSLSGVCSAVVYIEAEDYIYVNIYMSGGDLAIKGGTGYAAENAASVFKIIPIYYEGNVLTNI